jgi:predicted outer membrane repeat protein
MGMSKKSVTISARRATRRGLRPGCELLEGRALLATFQVADVAGLQAAVAAVNADPSKPATIELAPGTYDLTNELEFVHTSHLTIEGNPAGTVVLDNPTHSDRILEFNGPGDVTIEGLVITGGSAIAAGGAIYADGGGLLTIEQCTISGNTAFLDGGGIYTSNPLIVAQSTISGNTAQREFGGGIYTEDTLTVDQSTISGNSAGSNGGGIYGASSRTLTVDQSAISGNSAGGDGGGIFAGGGLSVSQSTASGNSAGGDGGGIFAGGGTTLTVDHSTISDNTATTGGGIYAIFATAEIDNSTLNDPVGGGLVNDHGTIHLQKTVVDGVLYTNQYYP